MFYSKKIIQTKNKNNKFINLNKDSIIENLLNENNVGDFYRFLSKFNIDKNIYNKYKYIY